LSITKISELGAHPAIVLGLVEQLVDLFDELQRRGMQRSAGGAE
jgi:hypothetical protein